MGERFRIEKRENPRAVGFELATVDFRRALRERFGRAVHGRAGDRQGFF